MNSESELSMQLVLEKHLILPNQFKPNTDSVRDEILLNDIFLKHYFFSVKPFVKNKDEFKNIVIKKGQQFVMDVKYGGEPEPSVLWKKDEKEINCDLDEKYGT